MPWRNGRYVPREITSPTEPLVTPKKIQNIARGAFRTTNLRSENFDDNLFDSTLVSRAFAASSFTASFLLQVIGKSTFTAASGLRGLFGSGFVDSSMIENGAITGAKITNPIKIALINGGAAGNHTVSGLTIQDELIGVFEQDGTSGILTDLSTEFSIKTSDTIDNTGGTATSGDKLLIFYLSK